MRLSRSTLLLSLLPAVAVRAHGGHEEVDESASYAQQHMSREHHISDFSLEAFFYLHDLDRDGILSTSELEQVYGLKHETARASSESADHHNDKARMVLEKALKSLDKNGDGVITKREFVEGGMAGLPNFKDMPELGHHYDVEGEYFLHHEELYHNTPATQTEESYNHPEDIEHFRNHEKIELEEENRARKAQGLPMLDELGREILDSAASKDQVILGQPAQAEKEAQEALLAEARKEAERRGKWGALESEFNRPKDLADRLRKSVPYKFRVKTNRWGEF